MEMRRLSANDYDELLDMLNSVFANKYGRAMDFLAEQPRMWVRSDEFMSKHIGIFDGERLAAVVGIYPLPTKIGDTSLLFATTGNVATRPEYEGRGSFTKIFTEIMAEADRMGVAVSRLGGGRQRYGRYGFEPAGTAYRFGITKETRVRFFGDAGADIEFCEIDADDGEALEFCRRLRHERKIHVTRASGDVYAYLTTKHSTPYIAMRGGRPIGYLSAYNSNQFVGRSLNGVHISEICADRGVMISDIVCAWQRRVNANIDFALPPYMSEEVMLFCAAAQSVDISSPSHFRVRDFLGLSDALMKLKASYARLAKGECVVGIKDYGSLKLFVREDGAGAEMTEDAADITVGRSVATRLLFGQTPVDAVVDAPDLLKLWLPLPLAWDGLDYV